MMRLPVLLFPVIALLLLAACVGSGGEPRRFFVLADETRPVPTATVGARGSIAVASTTAATSGVRADLLLTTVLLDLHHVAVKAPGNVRV